MARGPLFPYPKHMLQAGFFFKKKKGFMCLEP